MSNKEPISIYVDFGGFDGVEVYPGPEGDSLVVGGTFKTKAEAEKHAEAECVRLRKKGYEIDWAANY